MTPRAARVETPADTLRAAANTLRWLAELATDGPWGHVRDEAWSSVERLSGEPGEVVVSDGEKPDHEWIGTVGPQIAEPLAAWLDIEAQRYEVTAERMSEEWAAGEVQEATDFARVLLGVPVPEPDGEGTA